MTGDGADVDDTVILPPRAEAAQRRDVPDLDDTVLGHPASSPSAAAALQQPSRTTVAYRFAVGRNGQPIALDRPARIGRRPSGPRVADRPAPRLVRVASPLKEVSATHVELRQLGSSVVVTDLRSTNGTVVMQPGRPPQKLRQGESVVVSPGTLVDIGDQNILEILPMQRLGRTQAERQS